MIFKDLPIFAVWSAVPCPKSPCQRGARRPTQSSRRGGQGVVQAAYPRGAASRGRHRGQRPRAQPSAIDPGLASRNFFEANLCKVNDEQSELMVAKQSWSFQISLPTRRAESELMLQNVANFLENVRFLGDAARRTSPAARASRTCARRRSG